MGVGKAFTLIVEMDDCDLFLSPPVLEGVGVVRAEASSTLGLVELGVDLVGHVTKARKRFSTQVGEFHGEVRVLRFERSGE